MKQREIKFRVYDKVHKKMWSEFGNGSEETIVKGVNKTIMDYNNDHNWVLMQFTGVKDCSGNEIYEGDILRDIYNPHLYVVKFGYCKSHYFTGFFADVNNGFIQSPLNNYSDSDKNSSVEIIGNIYENPELITT